MILDTCALLWLAGDDRSRLSEETFSKIDQAPIVSVVAISGFEIALKCRAGKLHLPVAPQEWIETVLQFHRIEVIDLDLEMCIRATGLPPIHADACDRFIIAAAMIRDMPVVTADLRFAEYGVKVLG